MQCNICNTSDASKREDIYSRLYDSSHQDYGDVQKTQCSWKQTERVQPRGGYLHPTPSVAIWNRFRHTCTLNVVVQQESSLSEAY